MKKLYMITTGNACFSADTDENGKIIDIAPIGKRWLGFDINKLPKWAKVEFVREFKERV